MLVKRHSAPVNLVGGYRFPNAPAIDLSPIGRTMAPVAADAAALIATIDDDLTIPDFLKRTVPAASRPAATEKADAGHGADLHFQVAEEDVN